MNSWNAKDLPEPPINTYKATNRKIDINHLYDVFQEGIQFFDDNKFMYAEYAVLSRIVYRMKQKFRSAKDFKALEKITKALDNYFKIEISRNLRNFMELIPSRYKDVTYLPTKSLLDYILLRLQGSVMLMERIVETCKIAAYLLDKRIHTGHFWKIAFITFSIISRISILAKYTAKFVCNYYNKLIPFSSQLKNTSNQSSVYTFPKDLKEWLNVDWLEFDDDIEIIEVPTKLPDIIEFFDLVDDENDVQFCDEYFLIKDDDEEIEKKSKKTGNTKYKNVWEFRGFDSREDVGEVIEIDDSVQMLDDAQCFSGDGEGKLNPKQNDSIINILDNTDTGVLTISDNSIQLDNSIDADKSLQKLPKTLSNNKDKTITIPDTPLTVRKKKSVKNKKLRKREIEKSKSKIHDDFDNIVTREIKNDIVILNDASFGEMMDEQTVKKNDIKTKNPNENGTTNKPSSNSFINAGGKLVENSFSKQPLNCEDIESSPRQNNSEVNILSDTDKEDIIVSDISENLKDINTDNLKQKFPESFIKNKELITVTIPDTPLTDRKKKRLKNKTLRKSEIQKSENESKTQIDFDTTVTTKMQNDAVILLSDSSFDETMGDLAVKEKAKKPNQNESTNKQTDSSFINTGDNIVENSFSKLHLNDENDIKSNPKQDKSNLNILSDPSEKDIIVNEDESVTRIDLDNTSTTNAKNDMVISISDTSFVETIDDVEVKKQTKKRNKNESKNKQSSSSAINTEDKLLENYLSNEPLNSESGITSSHKQDHFKLNILSDTTSDNDIVYDSSVPSEDSCIDTDMSRQKIPKTFNKNKKDTMTITIYGTPITNRKKKGIKNEIRNLAVKKNEDESMTRIDLENGSTTNLKNDMVISIPDTSFVETVDDVEVKKQAKKRNQTESMNKQSNSSFINTGDKLFENYLSKEPLNSESDIKLSHEQNHFNLNILSDTTSDKGDIVYDSSVPSEDSCIDTDMSRQKIPKMFIKNKKDTMTITIPGTPITDRKKKGIKGKIRNLEVKKNEDETMTRIDLGNSSTTNLKNDMGISIPDTSFVETMDDVTVKKKAKKCNQNEGANKQREKMYITGDNPKKYVSIKPLKSESGIKSSHKQNHSKLNILSNTSDKDDIIVYDNSVRSEESCVESWQNMFIKSKEDTVTTTIPDTPIMDRKNKKIKSKMLRKLEIKKNEYKSKPHIDFDSSVTSKIRNNTSVSLSDISFGENVDEVAAKKKIIKSKKPKHNGSVNKQSGNSFMNNGNKHIENSSSRKLKVKPNSPHLLSDTYKGDISIFDNSLPFEVSSIAPEKPTIKSKLQKKNLKTPKTKEKTMITTPENRKEKRIKKETIRKLKLEKIDDEFNPDIHSSAIEWEDDVTVSRTPLGGMNYLKKPKQSGSDSSFTKMSDNSVHFGDGNINADQEIINSKSQEKSKLQKESITKSTFADRKGKKVKSKAVRKLQMKKCEHEFKPDIVFDSDVFEIHKDADIRLSDTSFVEPMDENLSKNKKGKPRKPKQNRNTTIPSNSWLINAECEESIKKKKKKPNQNEDKPNSTFSVKHNIAKNKEIVTKNNQNGNQVEYIHRNKNKKNKSPYHKTNLANVNNSDLFIQDNKPTLPKTQTKKCELNTTGHNADGQHSGIQLKATFSNNPRKRKISTDGENSAVVKRIKKAMSKNEEIRKSLERRLSQAKQNFKKLSDELTEELKPSKSYATNKISKSNKRKEEWIQTKSDSSILEIKPNISSNFKKNKSSDHIQQKQQHSKVLQINSGKVKNRKNKHSFKR